MISWSYATKMRDTVDGKIILHHLGSFGASLLWLARFFSINRTRDTMLKLLRVQSSHLHWFIVKMCVGFPTQIIASFCHGWSTNPPNVGINFCNRIGITRKWNGFDILYHDVLVRKTKTIRCSDARSNPDLLEVNLSSTCLMCTVTPHSCSQWQMKVDRDSLVKMY